MNKTPKLKRLTIGRETMGMVAGGAWHRTTHRCHQTWQYTDCCVPFTGGGFNCDATNATC